ncbi:hypothetical protein [Kutzneria sp. 744]|uniref:hypothetical protein n=1 Tax=Kutzneria sp. (strain 744) TaxID=345341 RepID=UPI0003EEB076|nr:hypothetical protein [Kutzneria sp. 744]EWM12278.1 ornithine cyclodeaminase [Kutzneria sp. 744]
MRVVAAEEIRAAVAPEVVFEAVKAALLAHAAGALITHALTPEAVDEIAVMGTGEQALLQMTWLARLRPIRQVHIWGRRPEAAALLCQQLRAHGLDARPDYETGAACVVTTTASPNPLPLQAFREAVHITGIGTDRPGKGELPPELFAPDSFPRKRIDPSGR